MTTASDAIRRLVVATRNLPILGRSYEHAFDRLVARTLSRIHVPDGIALYERRRIGGRAFEAGISDVDLLAILVGHPDAGQSLGRCVALDRAVRDARSIVPLVRDVHTFTESEFAYLAELASALVSVTRPIPISRRTDVRPSSLPSGAEASGIAALELAHFTTLRAARQLVEETEPLASALAMHALKKSPASIGAPHSDDAFESVVAALRRLDELHVRPRHEVVRSAPSEHPGIISRRDAVERWSASLRRLPALRSVALLADSPDGTDVRLVAILDPTHPSAASTLAAIARHRRRATPPSIADGAGPMRLHVLTESVLDRTWPTQIPSFEPLLRSASVAFGDPLPPARPDRPMIARSLAIGTILASSALRERASRPPTRTSILRARAIANGVLPSIEAFLDARPIEGETHERGTDEGVIARTLQRLHDAVDRSIPRLVALARPVLEGPSSVSGS